MTKNVFITYNASSEQEESTALRLQTISSLYGLEVSLPSRAKGISSLSAETKRRIEDSSFLVAFCIEKLSKLLKEELTYAIAQKKPLIVIYDVSKGKKINFKADTVKEIFVDFEKTDDALHEIAKFLRNHLSPSTRTKSANKKQNEDNSGLGIALLGIGLGLLAVWALSKDK